ncbi:hypothetical protein GQX73_g3464 [Xylaria multiplex]|uniref:SET domain-containing protein n=1 Tax=Xylaria multiplex TaxID=323545 RepID=A0A7C8N9S2_9PEZI|nr:hypothetical protein GQX73_g3464 [Xylaria multiplex]
MSDTSSVGKNEELLEVRDAGGGRGLGCFATRDIRPGEIVLVDYTPIHVTDTDDWAVAANEIVTIYESLDEHQQREWQSLHGHYRADSVEAYKKYLAKQMPDGSFFTETEQRRYLSLLVSFDCNNFDNGQEGSALFLRAARFNHSCDPNVSYECEEDPNRWVAIAYRDIKKGEELCINYIPTYLTTDRRRRATNTMWGFNCECTRCLGGVDAYTATLLQAREAANAFEPGKSAEPPVYPDDTDGMVRRVALRVNCLRDIITLGSGNGENDEMLASRVKELIFASIDASTFHQDYFLHWGWVRDSDDEEEKEDGIDPEEAERHSVASREYIQEALVLARIVWPVTHEILRMVERDAREAERLWNKWLKRDASQSGHSGEDDGDTEYDDADAMDVDET